MNNQQTADDAWREVVNTDRQSLQNAPWSSVYTKRALTYAGIKGITRTANNAHLTHYAILFRQEFIRLQQLDGRESEKQEAADEQLTELERVLYQEADIKSQIAVQKSGLPNKMSAKDAMREIRGGMTDG